MIDVLKKTIDSKPEKMISYYDYMKIVLYHPQKGYYMKDREKIGKKGDFITSSNFSDIYGRLVAKWYLKKVGEIAGLEPNVCEIGAGNGRFAAAFIDEWKKRTSLPLTYIIVEQSLYHRELQKEVLTFNEHIRQVETLEELAPFNGLVFSNELFDALPVHVVEKHDGRLFEVMVAYDQGKLVERRVPLTNKNILSFINDSGLKLQERQRIEIPLAMEEMIARISKMLHQGLVLTVDYGYTNEEWMHPLRRPGSLRGYFKHRQVDNCLLYPGEMDITSHVHFDSFILQGEKRGLRFVEKLRQDEFFLKIGILEELQEHTDPDPFSPVSRRNRAIKTLLLPGGISSHFHVILQKKNLDVRIEV